VIPRPAVLEGTTSPDPKELPEQNQKALDETGFSNWYDWATANWGTKWNSYSFKWILQEDERLVFTFETAWSTPEPVIRELVARYPRLEFSTLSFDEMWNWASEGSFNPVSKQFVFVDRTPSKALYKAVYGEEPMVTPEEETIQ